MSLYHKNRNRRQAAANILFTIAVNGFLPYFAYSWLKHEIPSLTALLIATLLPMIEHVVIFVKRRTLDAFGILMLGTFMLGVSLSIAGGDEKLVLLRESFVTSAVGGVFLLSLLFRRPLIYHLAKRFMAGKSAAALEERWAVPYIRFVFRLMTAVWGVLLLAESIIRVMLVYRLSTEQFLAVSPVLFYGVIGAAIVWTVGYRRHALRKFRQRS
jgi:intracellular septation protein A